MLADGFVPGGDAVTTSLFGATVDAVLAAPPSVTTTTGGASIPYPFPSPADWRDHWIYFLLVDRFNNPGGPPQPSTYPCNVYQGGTLAGVRQQLPYLQGLGVGAIWLSPILMNPPWFQDYWGGYGIMDFLRVEPRFCTNPIQAMQNPAVADRELRDLVDEAHARGIYVILDIVLNHVGDLFNYEGARDTAPWNPNREYQIFWRNAQGQAQGTWPDIAKVPSLTRDAGIWPQELQRNDFFRRRGTTDPTDQTRGDFDRLKELVSEYKVPGRPIYPLRDLLIRAHQYLIARFDIDGFRIDTLQYIEADFARAFGNAMREYGLSIGKKNFLTFGEVWQDDDEARIAEFIGRNTEKDQDIIGVDAAIDFPVRKRLVNACKGWAPPSDLATHLDFRRDALRKIVSSHGEASSHYVTFLDNHDLNERFHNPQFVGQTKVALACLMTLLGIPCVYYGTEQGLAGRGDRREYVREALWGQPNPFSTGRPLYQYIRDLSQLRSQQPALRYGRQYFRPCSGDGVSFGYSTFLGGIIAFSRILNDRELLVVANTSTTATSTVHVVVDDNLHPEGSGWRVLFPSNWAGAAPGSSQTRGGFKTVQVTLGPSDVLVLA
jgi:glycosidase